MPKFSYQARVTSGATVSGILEAVNSEGALDGLFRTFSEKVQSGIYGFKVRELEQYTGEIKAAVEGILATGRIQSEAVTTRLSVAICLGSVTQET